MNPNEELNGLGYVSSSSQIDLPETPKVSAEDEADFTTLKRILTLLDKRLAYYRSTDAFSLGTLTIENQLIINKQHENLINELRTVIVTTVSQVEEENARRFND